MLNYLSCEKYVNECIYDLRLNGKEEQIVTVSIAKEDSSDGVAAWHTEISPPFGGNFHNMRNVSTTFIKKYVDVKKQ